MRNRIKLKKIHKRNPIVSYILITIALVFLVSILLINLFSTRVTPTLLNFASLRIEKISNQVINNAISKEVIDRLQTDQLFSTVQNSSGQIVSVDFNPIIVNKVLYDASAVIQQNLKALEEGKLYLIPGYENIFSGYDIGKLQQGIIYELPLGAITNIPMLINIGPKVPVRYSFAGSLTTSVSTNVKNYGINNIMVEILIHIDVVNQVLAPLTSKRIMYTIDIPIATKIIQGEIPRYYHNGISQSSPILSIPME
jgi:sporulation protein YunB